MTTPSLTKPGPIVVVGAHVQSLFMHVERVPRSGETVLGWGYDEPVDGGKATNQAIAAARLGAPVAMVAVVGDDRFGEAGIDLLRAEGVETRWLQRWEGRTDVGFVMLGPDGIPSITTCSDLNRRFDGTVVDDARDAFAGSSVVVCQLEAPEAVARAAFSLGRSHGAVTILNPAPAGPVSRDLLELTDVLVPNEHEAGELLGRDVPTDSLAASLRDAFAVPTVIVTAGEAGAWLSDARGSARYPAPRVRVVDTTGAGDAFIGALATRLRVQDDLAAAVETSVALASLAVTRPGTIPSFPNRDDAAVVADHAAVVADHADAQHEVPR